MNVPHLKGTAHDKAINGFIDVINEKNDPAFTANAVAAIGKYLLESNELTAGPIWIKETLKHSSNEKLVHEPIVNSIHANLVEGIKEYESKGCGTYMFLLTFFVFAIMLVF